MGEKTLDKELKLYRDQLMLAEAKAQEDYDKTLVFLSSGAIAVTVSFIHNIIPLASAVSCAFIFFAWVMWGISLLCVLCAYLTSNYALRKSIQQVDNNVTWLAD